MTGRALELGAEGGVQGQRGLGANPPEAEMVSKKLA